MKNETVYAWDDGFDGYENDKVTTGGIQIVMFAGTHRPEPEKASKTEASG